MMNHTPTPLPNPVYLVLSFLFFTPLFFSFSTLSFPFFRFAPNILGT